MYGTGIGTGAAGASGAAMFAGMAVGSYLLMAVAAICFAVMLLTLARNHFRSEADQRP